VKGALLTGRDLLAPLGLLVGGAASLRVELYRRRVLTQSRLQGPVISVGNLSVGGSGKTPIVARFARMLGENGHAVSILTRGYGGSFRGDCLVVSDGTSVSADAALAGDEPVMLARALPAAVVAVGPRRDVVGREVERRFGPRVHLLDDGFQHLRLVRDLDIVCLSLPDLRDRPLPAGRLREPRSALRRAQALVLWRESESDHDIAAIVRELGSDRTHVAARKVLGFFTPAGEVAAAPARAFILCGIARPERLVADVIAGGTSLAGQARFRDHHRFRPAEIDEVVRRARGRRADAIITTEKDLLRLPYLPTALPVLVSRFEIAITHEERLRARVLETARKRTA
jgi:tetraacyldisaccharide 4'-kinase